jgi:GT2 family glycosyltransferase
MRISVVINTYNRAASLRQTLDGLRYQTHDEFEVVVVNGPSTDGTPAVLAECGGAIRVGSCPEVHLSKSRNVGIGLASGEVVAFIDDDAIPEPRWLEQLAAAYQDEGIGGAGGIVYDHTGFRLQFLTAACTRMGAPAPVSGPVAAYTRPGADPFLGLIGTNCSFRRDCLAAIGGFDEEIEYFLDETEVCLQVIDRGFTIRALPGAAVHHKYLASNRRSQQRLVLDPFAAVKNLCYFALQNGRRTRSVRDVLDGLFPAVEEMKACAYGQFLDGKLTAAQHEFYLRQLNRGMEVGLTRGLLQPRRRTEIPPADESRFLPFPALRPARPRRTFCFLARAYPPGDATEAGRCTRDLATQIAALGHDVHVVTRSPDTNRLDFEEGVWVHRLAPNDRPLPAAVEPALAESLLEAVAFYHEVRRIHGDYPADLVCAAPGDDSGLLCALDERFPTVTAAHGPADMESVRQYEQSIARHRATAPATVPFTPGPLPAVVAGLGAQIAWSAGLPPEEARAAAEKLLDPACHPVDFLSALGKVWRRPDDEFVGALYRLLLNREPTRGDLAHHVASLERGVSRLELARQFTAVMLRQFPGMAAPWLAELPALTERWDPPASVLHRYRRHARRALLLPLRLLGRVIRRVGAPVLRRLGSLPPLRGLLDQGKQLLRLPEQVSRLQSELHTTLQRQERLFWYSQAAALQAQQALLQGPEAAGASGEAPAGPRLSSGKHEGLHAESPPAKRLAG